MTRRPILTVLAVGLVAGAFAAPAQAKPKTISGKYTATAAVPDPTPVTGETGGNCSPTLAQAKHETKVKLPAAGTWKVDLNGMVGDWALAVLNDKGAKLDDSDNEIGTAPDSPEKITYKVKKAGTYVIRACNFSGGPTANVKWSFTYGK